jgi:hypothetical protein
MALFAIAVLPPVSGCGGGGRDLSVDKDVARSSLTKFLDAWN